MKSGFVTVLGRPNVGKSSIVNALVGEKVAIVSPKPQTTRDKILGIYNGDDYQIAFIDTPGIHAPKNKLGEYMMKSVKSATLDTDLVLIVASAELGLQRQDMDLIEKYYCLKVPMLLAYNKIDLVTPDRVLPELDKLNRGENKDKFDKIVPTSCRTRENIDILLSDIKSFMKEGEAYFPTDEYTDKSERYIIAETIREKILLFLQQEIPHGAQVVVEDMVTTDTSKTINALIVVEKESHKPIIIGKGGVTLKKIGMSARIELERTLGCKIILKTFVKVIDNWRNKPSQLSDLGYNPNDL